MYAQLLLLYWYSIKIGYNVCIFVTADRWHHTLPNDDHPSLNKIQKQPKNKYNTITKKYYNNHDQNDNQTTTTTPHSPPHLNPVPPTLPNPILPHPNNNPLLDNNIKLPYVGNLWDNQYRTEDSGCGEKWGVCEMGGEVFEGWLVCWDLEDVLGGGWGWGGWEDIVLLSSA